MRPGLLLVAAAILSFAARASAQDAPAATLRYERTAGAQRCMDEAELRELVAARLGRDPFVAEAPLAVRVTIEPRARGYVATIDLTRVDGEPGHREIEGARADCRDLADALALALSLAVDPASLVRRPAADAEAAAAEAAAAEAAAAEAARAAAEAEAAAAQAAAAAEAEARAAAEAEARAAEAAEAEAAAAEAAAAEAAAAEAARRAAAPSLTLRFGAALLLSYEVAPDVSAGLAVHAGLAIDAFSIDLELRGEIPTVHRAEAGSVRGAPFVAALVPCGHLDVVALCGVAAAGAFWGEGVDASEARSAIGPYVTVGARGGVEVPLGGGVDLRLFAQLDAPLVGASLAIGDARVWESPPVALSIGAGVGGSAP